MRIGYVRIFSDEGGESHFQDVTVELEPEEFAPPAPPLHVGQFLPADNSFWVGAAPDWGGDVPHPAPRRQVFCGVRGFYDVKASDGEVRRFGPGSVLLLEDTTGRGHSTTVVGGEEAVIFGIGIHSE